MGARGAAAAGEVREVGRGHPAGQVEALETFSVGT